MQSALHTIVPMNETVGLLLKQFYLFDIILLYLFQCKGARADANKNAATLNECDIDAYFLILRSICSFDDAMNTENAVES